MNNKRNEMKKKLKHQERKKANQRGRIQSNPNA